MNYTDRQSRRLVERLGDKFVFASDGCWLWTAALNSSGYAQLSIGRAKRPRAHRLLYELLVGPIPAGMQLDHLCRVRHCVNPAHLEIVTQRENILRGDSPSAANARKTHCYRGHAFTHANTGHKATNGTRWCRTCHRERMRGYRPPAKGSA